MSYFTDMDCYLFGQGTHYDIYRKLGAHYVNEKGKNGKKGVCFDVWAPNARNVYVIGDFNGWNEYSHEMQRVEPTSMGVYELFVPEAKLGSLYKYLIIAKDGTKHYKADPYGNYAQMRPETASIVVDINNIKWTDDAWMKKRAAMTEEDVIEYCRGKISKYKWPQFFMFLKEFPMTGSGKIQKFKLTEMGTKYRKEVLGIE